MKRPVVPEQSGRLGPDDFTKRFLARFGGDLRIEGGDRLLQPPFEDDILVTFTLRFGLPRGDVRAVEDGLPKRLKPFESRVLDDGLADAGGHFRPASCRSPVRDKRRCRS